MSLLPEVQLYIDKAYLTLVQAQDILKLNYYDLTISRAYYAMFYAANALLSSQNISVKKHTGVQAMLAQHFIKPGLIEPEYGRMLGYAFNLRQSSDYDIAISRSLAEAENILHNAEAFVERIKDYLLKEGLL